MTESSKDNFLKEMYENILNSLDVAINCIDVNGNFIVYNHGEENLVGCKASEVLGRHITEFYDLDFITSLSLQVLRDGMPVHNIHQEYFTKSGKLVDVLTSVMPLYSGNKIIGSFAVSKDFSQFRSMAEKILDLQEKLTVKSSKIAAAPPPEKHTTFEQLIGSNKKFMETIDWAKEASKTDSSILLCGETGTGKELFAQSIHKESRRSDGPFLAINCAAIPESLLESILFGTVKGAFTGAITREGLFEQANGGTLFLDEINSMPLALQAKILRVLEERVVRRVGGDKEIPVNPRIISSCNVTPTAAIEQGQIRADLFYRLAVVYLHIPPLRKRLDDIELLTCYFIQKFNASLGKQVKGLHAEVMSAFKRYHWPGNIRQLKHTIESAMNIVPVKEKSICPGDIPSYLGLFNQEILVHAIGAERETNASGSVLTQIKEEEKNVIIAALKASQGNIARAARELGLSKQLLRYRLKKYDLL